MGAKGYDKLVEALDSICPGTARMYTVASSGSHTYLGCRPHMHMYMHMHIHMHMHTHMHAHTCTCMHMHTLDGLIGREHPTAHDTSAWHELSC